MNGDSSRLGTAITLRALDASAGGGFYAIPEAAEHDDSAAAEAFAATGPVIDVQTHLIDPQRWQRRGCGGAGRLPADGRPRPLARRGRPAPARRGGVGDARVRIERDRDRVADVHPRWRRPQRAAQPADRGDTRARRPLRGQRTAAHPCHRAPEPRRPRARRHGRRLRRAPALGVEVLPAVRAADERVPHRRMVPRRRRDRVPVPRARAAVGHQRRRRAQGVGRPDPLRVGGGGVAARHRTGRGGVPGRELPRVPLRATSAIPTGRKARSIRSRPGGSTASSRAWPPPGSRPARTCTRSSAARGTSCCGARSRPRTCWASCCSRSVPIASCGAPTRSGTDHRNR